MDMNYLWQLLSLNYNNNCNTENVIMKVYNIIGTLNSMQFFMNYSMTN